MNDWSWFKTSKPALPFKKGDYLFKQGDPIKQMHVIETGRVKLFRHTEEGGIIVLHMATDGELLAEASFFFDTYHCSAIADRASLLHSIDRDWALQKILSSPEQSQKTLKLFAQQVRDLRGLVELRNIRSARSRILAYLNSASDADGVIDLSMSLRDLAYWLGLAHETLYRELKQLEVSGAIERPSPGKLILHK